MTCYITVRMPGGKFVSSVCCWLTKHKHSLLKTAIAKIDIFRNRNVRNNLQNYQDIHDLLIKFYTQCQWPKFFPYEQINRLMFSCNPHKTTSTTGQIDVLDMCPSPISSLYNPPSPALSNFMSPPKKMHLYSSQYADAFSMIIFHLVAMAKPISSSVVTTYYVSLEHSKYRAKCTVH